MPLILLILILLQFLLLLLFSSSSSLSSSSVVVVVVVIVVAVVVSFLSPTRPQMESTKKAGQQTAFPWRQLQMLSRDGKALLMMDAQTGVTELKLI